MFTFDHLQAVLLVLEAGNVSTAIPRSGVAEATFRKRIRQARKHFKDELFVVTRGRAVPTALGRGIEERGRQIASQFEQLAKSPR